MVVLEPAPNTSYRPPHLHLRYGNPVAPNTEAVYTGGTGTDTTVFTATVEDQGDAPYSRIDVYQESLSTEIWDWTPGQDAVGSTITSVATGKHAILGHGYFRGPEAGTMNQAQVRSGAPAITGVPAFNDPGDDGVFDTGDTVEVTFTFSQAVRVDTKSGTPSVPVLLGGTTSRQALYLRGSGTGQLVFGYTLADGDGTHGSLLVKPNTLALNGGSIRDVANGLPAAIGHEGGGTVSLRQARDETPPQLRSAAVDGSSLTLAFDEDLDTSGKLPSNLFAVNVNGASRTVTRVAVSGTGVTLSLSPATAAGDTVTVAYTVPKNDSADRLRTGRATPWNPSASRPSPTTPVHRPTVRPQARPPSLERHRLARPSPCTPPASPTPTVLTNATFAYQWLADDADISGATGSTYTLTSSEQGKAIKVRVSFTDDGGNDESLTSAATDAVTARANSPATGAPTISGTAQVGETLTASTSGIADGDGLTSATFAYQWLADDADIGWATSSTYTLTASEQGKAIKVQVSFTDDAGNDESLTSAATDAVTAGANSPATGAPTISGTAQVGETLTASTSGIADGDGLTNATFAYQWLADDADIGGATSSTYTLTASEQGKAIKVQVSFTDDAGNEETVTTTATAAVTDRANSPATGAPTISGTAQVGETLTASTSGIADGDGLTNATFAYQWLADDTDISGATSSTYTLTAGEQGKAIKVRATFTDDAGNEESLTSAATAAVTAGANSPATGAPAISGTAQVGETLTADTSGIADEDGLTNATFAYQWLADDTDISGATSSTYTLTAGEQGKAIKVRVSFTDDAGIDETLTSAATAAVTAGANSPATGAPAISGKAQVGETLTADTSGIADTNGLANATFTYQWLADDTAIAGATSSTYTVTSSEQGKAIKVQVSFTDDAGNEESLASAATDAVTARANSPATGAPTISGTAQVARR